MLGTQGKRCEQMCPKRWQVVTNTVGVDFPEFRISATLPWEKVFVCPNDRLLRFYYVYVYAIHTRLRACFCGNLFPQCKLVLPVLPVSLFNKFISRITA